MPGVIRRLALPLLLATAAGGAGLQACAADRAADMAPGPARESAYGVPATPVLSARRIPVFLQAPVADRTLVAELDAVVGKLPAESCVSVAEHGRVLYAYRPEDPLVPASTQKLLTALAALEVFGPDHVFTTRVVTRIPPVDGRIDGDIWLVGGGDPLLMTTDYAERFEDPFPYTDMDRLAAHVASTGVTLVTGAIIGDESRFDSLRWVDTWPERFRAGAQNQAGPLSALSVNAGFAKWDPSNISNGFSTPASDPAAHGAAVFDDMLEDRGLAIRRPAQAGIVPGDANMELGRVESPPVRDIVAQMLVGSDNTTAELLIKALAAAQALPGTSVGGLIALVGALGGNGHSSDGLVVNDGSGLDPGNLVTCRFMTGLLEDTEHGPDLLEALPVAGQSGTLRERLVGTAAEGRMRAKTGSLRDVVSLVGAVETLTGRTLAFAMVTNAEGSGAQVKALHDRVVLGLVPYPDGPPLELLGPLPVDG